MITYLAPVIKNGDKHIGIYGPDIFSFYKLMESSKSAWDEKSGCFITPYNERNFRAMVKALKTIGEVNAFKEPVITKEIKDLLFTSLSDDCRLKLHKFNYYLKSKRYSESTIRTYLGCLEVFFKFYKDIPVHRITNENVLHFNELYILKLGLSGTYQNQFVNALKLFYIKEQDHQLKISDLIRPRREKKLPNVLSKQEVKKILDCTRNIKHRMILSLIYSCGFRSGEIISLRPTDIEPERGLIRVNQGKGNKDRVVPLSLKILEMLREYYRNYKPKVYMFEGEHPGERYSQRSIQQLLKRSVKLAGINKPVTPHWLRHSAATHLLEKGTDIRYIQEILGHASTRTTEIYTHVSDLSIRKIISPFDDL